MLRIRNLLLFVIMAILVVGLVVPVSAQEDKTVGNGVVIDEAGPIRATSPYRAKAEAEFRKVALAKEQAFYAGDTEAVFSFYADDVVSIQPGLPEVVGKEALIAGLQPFLESYTLDSGKLVFKHVNFYGNQATRQAEWEEVWTAKDGSGSFRQVGRCLLVWEKIDGEWKVVSEILNYLEPPTEVVMAE